MQEELMHFKASTRYGLEVDLPNGAKVIGTKWVYRNKKDERGVVVRNKARLVAQGHRQEEGISTMIEIFAHCGELEHINGVYVSQPPVLLMPDHPKKFNKSSKAKKGIIITQDNFACSRQVTPKGLSPSLCRQENFQVHQGENQKLGLWYTKEIPLDLVLLIRTVIYVATNLDRSRQQLIQHGVGKDVATGTLDMKKDMPVVTC
ncbi:putative ribonuclease H-like domain-containing protein [Tanacetum coccineum]